jgi:hypothetical protein
MALSYLAVAAFACLFILGGGIAMQAAGGVGDHGTTRVVPATVPSGVPTTWPSDIAAAAVEAGTSDDGGTPAAVAASTGKDQNRGHPSQAGAQGAASKSTQGAVNSQRTPQHAPKAAK